MRVVFATTFLPSARLSGSDIASDNIVEAMRLAGHEVTVLGYSHPSGCMPGSGERSVGPTTGEWSRTGTLGRGRCVLAALARGRAVASQKFVSAAYLRTLPLAARECDIWVINPYHLDWLAPPGPPVVAVVQDIQHRLSGEQATLHPAWSPRGWMLRRESQAMERAEHASLKRATAAWTLSEADASDIAAHHATVHVLPLPGLAPPSAPPPALLHDIGILGLWTWEPNRRGLQWFLERVVPLLPDDLRISIAGRGAEALRMPKQVRSLGFVEDATAFMRASRLLVVPSIAGSGIQIKSINAIALGVPTVATGFAMRSLEPLPPWVRLADTPEAMAEAIIRARHELTADPVAGAAWRQARATRLAGIVDRDLRLAVGGGR